MIYNSFIKKGLIDRIRNEYGSIFWASAPDIQSGLLFSNKVKRFLNSSVPVSIAGGSGKSNGIATLFAVGAGAHTSPGEESISSDFNALNQEQDLTWPDIVPNVPFLPATVAECIYRTKEKLYGKNTIKPISEQLLVSQLYRHALLWRGPDPDSHWRTISDFASSHGIRPMSRSQFEMTTKRQFCEDSLEPPFDTFSQNLSLSTSGLSIRTIKEASDFISLFLNYKAISENFRVQTYVGEVVRKARSLASTVLFHRNPRSWEMLS